MVGWGRDWWGGGGVDRLVEQLPACRILSFCYLSHLPLAARPIAASHCCCSSSGHEAPRLGQHSHADATLLSAALPLHPCGMPVKSVVVLQTLPFLCRSVALCKDS